MADDFEPQQSDVWCPKDSAERLEMVLVMTRNEDDGDEDSDDEAIQQ